MYPGHQLLVASAGLFFLRFVHVLQAMIMGTGCSCATLCCVQLAWMHLKKWVFACRLHAACTSMWAQDNLLRMFLHAQTCHTHSHSLFCIAFL